MSKKVIYPEYSEEIDQYISQFAQEFQDRMKLLRSMIHELVPEVTERISYQMPTFYLHENLVHFSCFKNHLGFYPTPSGITAFEKELSAYQWSKGAVQFPHDKELPLDLIHRMIEFRKNEVAMKYL